MSNIDASTQQNEQEGGLRYNSGKPSISQVPPEAIAAIAKVLDFGTRKYARYNWRKGLSWTQTYDSAQRHMMKWLNGAELDDESGLPHLWHAATNLAFLITFQDNNQGTDDRYTGQQLREHYREKVTEALQEIGRTESIKDTMLDQCIKRDVEDS